MLSERERLIFAYFLTDEATRFAMVPRFWPRGELLPLLEDKVSTSVRKFGAHRGPASGNVARTLLDELIDSGAFSTRPNDFGGTMHQFQPDAYKAYLRARAQGDPIVTEARAAGDDFWRKAFDETKA